MERVHPRRSGSSSNSRKERHHQSRSTDRWSQSPFPNQDAGVHLKLEKLADGFSEMKKTFTQLLGNFDFTNCGVSASEELLEKLETVGLGGKSLREIGCAIIERDPHYACMEKVFDDLWLFGFTRVLRLSIKLQEASTSAELSTALGAWRKAFINNWIGALYKIQDTLQLYKDPRSTLQFIPSFENSIPPGYHATTEAGGISYRLPMCYLLRDIALCLARAYGYEDKEMEGVFMERAYIFNVGISGRRYKDAWEHYMRIDNPIMGKPKPVRNRSPVMIYNGAGEERSFAAVAAGINGDLSATPPMNDNDQWTRRATSVPLVVASASPEEPVSRESTSSLRRDSYGPVTATLDDLAVLKPFVFRNSFLEGLVRGAENQGLISVTEKETMSEGDV